MAIIINNWRNELYDCIGWSTSNEQWEQYLPNGLFGVGMNDCTLSKKETKQNIFYNDNNSFIYVSNNKNYKNRLPGIKNGDIIVLEYNSDESMLSFSKENDNGKLNSSIKNLPTQQTFYWFVGHECGKMCLNVLS